jgi:hypothetical protein
MVLPFFFTSEIFFTRVCVEISIVNSGPDQLIESEYPEKGKAKLNPLPHKKPEENSLVLI